jgi:hypothetical protein
MRSFVICTSLLHVVKGINSREMRWDGNVTCKGEVGNVYKIFSCKTWKKVTTWETKEEFEI